MKSFRGVVCVVALAGASVWTAWAQERPTKEQSALIAAWASKKGYDYYHASSDLRTKSGDVYAWAAVQVAHESDSGMAAGKRELRPFVMLKAIDASSSKLAAMAASHEPIPELTMTLDGASKDAAKSVSGGPGVGKVVFQDLHIVSIRKLSATMEEITMTYERTVAPDKKGGIGLEDKDVWAKSK